METNESNFKWIGTILYHFNILIIKIILEKSFYHWKSSGSSVTFNFVECNDIAEKLSKWKVNWWVVFHVFCLKATVLWMTEQESTFLQWQEWLLADKNSPWHWWLVLSLLDSERSAFPFPWNSPSMLNSLTAQNKQGTEHFWKIKIYTYFLKKGQLRCIKYQSICLWKYRALCCDKLLT